MFNIDNFMVAVSAGNINAVQEQMKDKGFNIDAQSGTTEQTALHIAISKCNVELVTLLILNNAKCNIKAKYDISPLMLAISCSEFNNNKGKFEEYVSIIVLLLREIIKNKSESFQNKVNAINILSKKKDLPEEAVQVLIEICKDNDWHVRRAAIEALSQQKTISYDACLIFRDAQSDENAAVRHAADAALVIAKKQYPNLRIPDIKIVEKENKNPQNNTFLDTMYSTFSTWLWKSRIPEKEDEIPFLSEKKGL